MTPRAAVWTGSGFDVRDVASPALAAGEAMVAIDLATVCGSDRHTVAGRRSTPVPTVLGHEGVGRVVEVGPLTSVAVGDRVVWGVVSACGVCRPCVRGIPQKCTAGRKYGHARITPGWALSGTFATHVHLVTGTEIVRVPEHLDDLLVAPAGCATATVVAATRRGELHRGDVVAVSGCGMLGLTAIAYAMDRGASRVIAVDPDRRRREAAGAFGASTCEPVDLLAAVGPDGADVVLEMSGAAPAVATAVAAAAIGGRIVLAGSVAPGPPVSVDPERVVRRLLTVTGSHNYGPADLYEAVAFLSRTRHADELTAMTVVGGSLDVLDDVFGQASPAPRVAIRPATHR